MPNPRHTALQHGLHWKETALCQGHFIAGTTLCPLRGSLLGVPAAKSWRSCEWHLHSTQLASASFISSIAVMPIVPAASLQLQLSNSQASLIPPNLVHKMKMVNSVQSNMTDRRKKKHEVLVNSVLFRTDSRNIAQLTLEDFLAFQPTNSTALWELSSTSWTRKVSVAGWLSWIRMNWSLSKLRTHSLASSTAQT